MKILLVDDALDMRLVMKRTLTLMEHEVTVAEDGEAAWQCLQQDNFQVVITDWIMPQLDGPGLCRRIRESSFAHYLYIIMLTGLSGKPNLIAGMDAGADAFANKPIETDEMAVLLRVAERVISLERKLELQNQHLADANLSLQQTQNEVQQDLHHAAVLQKGILPDQQRFGSLDFAWFYRPASFIGGDTFNYFPLDEGSCLFYTVDVSGHGISSALLSMYLSNLLTSSANSFKYRLLANGDETVCAELNKLVSSFNTHLQDVLEFSDHYFTMILGVINTRRQRLHFVQAGHPKPFLVDTKLAAVKELDCTGFPVGLIPEAEYEALSHDFPAGSRLVLFSDGMFELSKTEDDLYGADDLAGALQNTLHLNADATVSAIFERWQLNKTGPEQPDDLSLLIVDSTD